MLTWGGLVDTVVFPASQFRSSRRHVVPLGGTDVLIAASAPATPDLLAELGYDASGRGHQRVEKLEGCVTCLSVLIPNPARAH